MAAPQELHDKLVCPDDRTIAFAISIVESKPPELTVAAYIRLLVQHIAKGRRENSLSNVHRHLDRSSYWRSEYERTKDALKAAEYESVDLRLQIETLKLKAEAARPASPTKKRKKHDADVIPIPRSPKRAKRDASPVKTVPGFVDSSADAEFSQAGEIGDALLRCLFQLHTSLKRSSKTEPNDLAYHIVRAASTIPQLVQQEVERIVTEQAAGNYDLKTVLIVTARAVASIFTACNRLGHMQGGAGVQGRVIHAVVHMFKDLLDNLEILSAEEAENDLLPGVAETAPASPVKAKPNAKAKTPKASSIKENPTLSLYISFLAGIMDKLDAKIETNKNLFEGFAYCILQKLGKRLYSSVFGHARAADLGTEIQQSAADDDVEGDGNGNKLSSQFKDTKQKQIRLEAPYLVHLMHRMMVAAPTYLGSIQGRVAKAKQASKASLAIPAKECLQRTLINSTFGTEGNDEEDLFQDCLKMPPVSEGTLSIPKLKEEDVQSWYKEEMWRVLGWEILAKDDDW